MYNFKFESKFDLVWVNVKIEKCDIKVLHCLTI